MNRRNEQLRAMVAAGRIRFLDDETARVEKQRRTGANLPTSEEMQRAREEIQATWSRRVRRTRETVHAQRVHIPEVVTDEWLNGSVLM